MAPNPATMHQNFNAFPKLDSTLINPDGTPTIPWYRFLVNLWKKSGVAPASMSVVLEQAPGGGLPITALNASTGDALAVLATVGPTGPAVPQVVGPSPWVFKAPGNGTLTVTSGAIALSRDLGKTYYSIGLTGGAIPVKQGDQVQVTWFGAIAPQAVFFS